MCDAFVIFHNSICKDMNVILIVYYETFIFPNVQNVAEINDHFSEFSMDVMPGVNCRNIETVNEQPRDDVLVRLASGFTGSRPLDMRNGIGNCDGGQGGQILGGG